MPLELLEALRVAGLLTDDDATALGGPLGDVPADDLRAGIDRLLGSDPEVTDDVLAQASQAADGVEACEACEAEQLRTTEMLTPGAKRQLATVRRDYPVERHLGSDPWVNQQRLNAVVGADALTAAGGRCGPVNVSYAMDLYAINARRVRNALPRFEANRGGIPFFEHPSRGDVAGGAGVWTNANDVTAADNDGTGAP